MRIVLNKEETEALFHQPRESKADGGFQYLLVRLQEKFDKNSSSLDLSDSELEQISRYAFDFGRGGYETRLIKIFGRNLGKTLDRRSEELKNSK